MQDTAPTPKLTRAEAARLNGAKSRGPVTPEGKARSSMNALKHGLTAQAFALLPGEDAGAYAGLLDGLLARYRPADALALHLVQRLASVMWRQHRADRLEAEVLTQLEQRPHSAYLGGYVPASPPVWDAARFSAVQRQQARLERTFFRLMDELERLTPAEEDEDESWPNEPETAEAPPPATPANDDAANNVPNEPEPAAADTYDDPLLPLTPELRALLDAGGEDNWRAFCRGRRAQIEAALAEMGRPRVPNEPEGPAGAAS